MTTFMTIFISAQLNVNLFLSALALERLYKTTERFVLEMCWKLVHFVKIKTYK